MDCVDGLRIKVVIVGMSKTREWKKKTCAFPTWWEKVDNNTKENNSYQVAGLRM
jgi:hypothetical protein